jgi:hypothetical protein
MRDLYHFGKHFLTQLTILLIGVATAQCSPTPAQARPDRFWLAGRYDGNRVIVYFDAVKFNGTLPTSARKLAPPLAERFFDPVELPASYIAQFQKKRGAEHFMLGGKYDLLLDYGKIATVTLTTLVGTETDEQVGNDSFIGAMATLDDEDVLYLRESHYALRRHQEPPASGSGPATKTQTVFPGLQDEPLRFDIQTRIVALLNSIIKGPTSGSDQCQVEGISPTFAVQAFRVADGSLRYYAKAAWSTGEQHTESEKTICALGAWISPLPELHILAVEKRTSPYDGLASVLPDLLNVVDLGLGKTGIIIGISGEDGGSLDLVEYHDGMNLSQMLTLQSIGAGE